MSGYCLSSCGITNTITPYIEIEDKKSLSLSQKQVDCKEMPLQEVECRHEEECCLQNETPLPLPSWHERIYRYFFSSREENFRSAANLNLRRELVLFTQRYKIPLESSQKEIDPLMRLQYVEKLSIVGRKITKIPHLSSLLRLQYLNLSDNSLSKIPEEIIHLMVLEVLDISHNKVTDFPFFLSSLKKLRTLILSHNLMKDQINLSKKGFKALETLDLSYNQIGLLMIGKHVLKKISKLCLQSNCLRSIPLNINQKGHLRYLNISQNLLSFIASFEVISLYSLRFFSCSHNYISDFPLEMSKMKKIRNIDMSCNQLTHIPDWIVAYQDLEHFFLRGNELRSINLKIVELKSLRHFDIRENCLSSIPEEFLNLNHLKILHDLKIENSSIEELSCHESTEPLEFEVNQNSFDDFTEKEVVYLKLKNHTSSRIKYDFQSVDSDEEKREEI